MHTKTIPLSTTQSEEVERTIQSYENGEITYDQAHQMIVEICGDHPSLYLAEIELFAARELKTLST